jgi:AcrR family transcriptional regulator
MPKPAVAHGKKRAYHHGDLERALIETAVQVIQEEGVQALTLRDVGARLGVSRTALYRHFDGKEALLARVASEGFKRFHSALAKAADGARARRADPLPAMALAYLRFARAHPSHYRTMFSSAVDMTGDAELARHGEAAFNVLLDAIRAGQRQGRIRAGDPVQLAEITWAMSHGIATLGMANQIGHASKGLEELARLGCAILERGLEK